MDILTFPEDPTPVADEYVLTEKSIGGRVHKRRTKPESLVVRATGTVTEKSLATWTAETKVFTDLAVTATGPELNAADISAKVTFIDDFLGDFLADEWTIITGNDAQAVAAAIAAGASNGTVAMTSGDSNPGVTAADAAGLTLGLNWAAAQGGLVFEARVKIDAITLVKAFVGFTDTIALEFPIISNGTTGLTATADDAVGFLFDTIGTDPDAWMTAGVKATTATARTKGSAPVADTYDTLRIEIDSSGTATFYQNGTLVATVANSVTAATLLTPLLIVMENGAAATRKLTADYVFVQKNRV